MGASDAPAATSTAAPGPSWQLQTLAFTCFAAGNIGLNEFNSWALKADKYPAFTFPVFYTMWHMITSSLAALLLLNTVAPPKEPTTLPSFKQLSMYWTSLVPIAMCTATNNALNNVSLTLVSLFVNQTIKVTAPLPTMLLSYLIAGQRFGTAVMAAVGFVVLGSVLAGYYQLTSGSKSSQSNQASGIVVCLISLLAASLKPVLASLLMKSGTKTQPKLPPTLILFYDTGFSFFFMLTYWLASNERAASIEYLRRQPALSLGIISAGASMAFIFNLSTYYYVLYTSALTSTIGSNGIKIFLIVISAIQAGVKDATSWTGVAIVVLSIGAYAYFSYQEKQGSTPAQPAAGAREERAEKGMAEPMLGAKAAPPLMTEATPLVSNK